MSSTRIHEVFGAGGSFATSDTSVSLSTVSESLAYRYSVLQNGWSSGYSAGGPSKLCLGEDVGD